MTEQTKSVPRIVFITPSLGAGGIERIVSKLANHFVLKGKYEVKIICFGKKEIFYKIHEEIEVIVLPEASLSIMRFQTKLYYLRRILHSLKPIAMISFGSMYNSFFLLASLGIAGKKFVSDRSNPWRNSRLLWHKGGLERHDGWHHYFLKKVLYRTATKILAQTRLSLRIESDNFGLDKVLYFPNPVDRPLPTKIEKRRIILNVGRFVRSKGQQDLLRVYAGLDESLRREWSLVFIGGGDGYFNECKRLCDSLDISKDVSFIGFTTKVWEWYAKADIFAFTSFSEGFPNALAEAMAHGCACIAYDCVAGPSDIISDNVNGLLVNVGSVQSFRDKLKVLLKDENLRRELQFQAKRIIESFSLEEIASKLSDEIDKD